jgi:DNA-binding NarL/FixJ family response regulator
MNGPSPVIAPGNSTVPLAAPLARVVLVDVRTERMAVMRTLLEGTELVSVVGEADSEAVALAEVERGHADLAVVEVQMPVAAGLAMVSALRGRFPELRIVVCSFHLLTATKDQAIENGADDYLAKPVDVRALGRLLRHYAATPREPAVAATPREPAVAAMPAAG